MSFAEPGLQVTQILADKDIADCLFNLNISLSSGA